MRLFQAFKVFFQVLFNGSFAAAVRGLEEGTSDSGVNEKPTIQPPAKKPKPKPSRSDALTLLATLQREARLLDLVQEPLADYSDEQIGGAARDVLRDSAKVLDRLFDIQALGEGEEGSTMEAPADHDPQKYHLIGNVSGEGPFRGQMTHHGWIAGKCEIPQWSGAEESRLIIAPIEIQV